MLTCHAARPSLIHTHYTPAPAHAHGCARTVVPARESAVGFWRRGRFEELERSGRAATAAAAARLGIGEFTGARLLVYHHRRWRTWAVV